MGKRVCLNVSILLTSVALVEHAAPLEPVLD